MKKLHRYSIAMNELNKEIYKNLELLPLDLQGWNGDNAIFKKLILQTMPETIIEVGTWKGQSAINMALICKELKLKTKIYCIDTWLGAIEFWTTHKNTQIRNLQLKNGYPQIYYQFLSNVVHKEVQEFIIPVPLPSSLGLKLLYEKKITANLIYIDGSHEYKDVLDDCVWAIKLLDNNMSCIFGDDYNIFSDVRQAVNKVFPNRLIKDNFWIYNVEGFKKCSNVTKNKKKLYLL